MLPARLRDARFGPIADSRSATKKDCYFDFPTIEKVKDYIAEL
jgi:hypothetical protein